MPRTRKPAPPSLIGVPYAAPAPSRGGTLFDERRGELLVGGLTDAPVPWPYAAGIGGHRPSLILCGDLVRAVRTETVAAVAHHWGVDRSVVGDWRRALGVGRMTEGGKRRWEELARTKLTTEARRAGGRTRVRQRRAAKSMPR